MDVEAAQEVEHQAVVRPSVAVSSSSGKKLVRQDAFPESLTFGNGGLQIFTELY
jgi:hypothetical protein